MMVAPPILVPLASRVTVAGTWRAGRRQTGRMVTHFDPRFRPALFRTLDRPLPFSRSRDNATRYGNNLR